MILKSILQINFKKKKATKYKAPLSLLLPPCERVYFMQSAVFDFQKNPVITNSDLDW